MESLLCSQVVVVCGIDGGYMLYSNDKVTYNCCEVTVVTRKTVDSGEMTRSSEDVHFIVTVSTTQSL